MLSRLRPVSRRARPYPLLAIVGACLLTMSCDARIGPPAGTEPVDAGQVGDDAPPGGGVDAPGQPVTDAAPPAPDAPEIDAPPAPCDVTYSGAGDYVLCNEEPDRCDFNAVTVDSNCDEVCRTYGGTCITAYDNDPGLPCGYNDEEGCLQDNRDDEICACSRP